MDELILLYLQGKATQEQKKALYQWISKSKTNRKTFMEIRDIWLKTEQVGNPEYVEKAFFHFVTETNRSEKTTETFKIGFFWRSTAAIFLLLLSCGIGYWGGRIYDTNQPDSIVMNQVIMGRGNKGEVLLPDGTKVWLNAESKLIYPEQFSNKERVVTLDGEAYFEVTPDKKNPFYVQTEDISIRVLGTSFNIKNYAGNEYAETVLLSGSILFFEPEDETGVRMKPGEMISFSKSSLSSCLNSVNNASEYILWIQDRLEFVNEPLGDILRKMEKWYNIDIKIDPGVDLNEKLLFTIRRETAEEIFKIVEMISSIKYTIEGKQVIVYPNKK